MRMEDVRVSVPQLQLQSGFELGEFLNGLLDRLVEPLDVPLDILIAQLPSQDDEVLTFEQERFRHFYTGRYPGTPEHLQF